MKGYMPLEKSSVKGMSSIVAREIINTMAPEEVDNCDIIIEEYLEWLHSNIKVSKEKRLGFISELMSPTEWFAAMVCAVVVDTFIHFLKVIRNRKCDLKVKKKDSKLNIYKKGNHTSDLDEIINKLGEKVYDLAIKTDIQEEKAKKISKLFVETLSAHPELLMSHL